MEKPLKCVACTIKNDEFIRMFCSLFTLLLYQIQVVDRIEMIHNRVTKNSLNEVCCEPTI